MQVLANEACDSEQDLETKALEIRRHRRLLQQQMIRKLCAVCGLTFSLLSGRGGEPRACKGSCAMCSLISVCRLAGDCTCELASLHANRLLCAHAAMNVCQACRACRLTTMVRACLPAWVRGFESTIGNLREAHRLQTALAWSSSSDIRCVFWGAIIVSLLLLLLVN